jgi:hypothetical protein
MCMAQDCSVTERIDAILIHDFQNWEDSDFRPTVAKYRNLVWDTNVAP